MSLKGLMDVEIRKEPVKYRPVLNRIPIKKENYIDPKKFVEFIDSHLDFFTWHVEKDGSVDKRIAHSHPVKGETYYRFRTILREDGYIYVDQTAPAKMTVQFLELLLDLAEYCEADLYRTATKIVTREFLQKEKENSTRKGGH